MPPRVEWIYAVPRARAAMAAVSNAPYTRGCVLAEGPDKGATSASEWSVNSQLDDAHQPQDHQHDDHHPDDADPTASVHLETPVQQGCPPDGGIISRLAGMVGAIRDIHRLAAAAGTLVGQSGRTLNPLRCPNAHRIRPGVISR